MTATLPRFARSRSIKLSNCGSALAMTVALATLYTAANAQSLEGTPSVVSGAANITTGAGTTNIRVGTAEAVINWDIQATPGIAPPVIPFQNTGTTATFTNDTLTGTGDYTVLNRILITDVLTGNPYIAPVSMDGTVNAFVSGVRGGNVWFYTPNGLIVGPNAQMNVGSLLLTTIDPNLTGGLYNGVSNQIRLDGSVVPASYVRIDSGAQITTGTAGTRKYALIAAPRVEQGGTISADSSIGLIAGEQMTISLLPSGLIGYSIPVGTSDANGIVHTGTTTGPVSAGLGDPQRLSMIAATRAASLTMLLSGSIGYTPAAVAGIDGSSIVLSATADPANLAPANSNISLGGSTFSNSLIAIANNNITVASGSGATLFNRQASLDAGNLIDIAVGAGDLVNAGNALDLRAGQNQTGGTINLTATGGGTIAVSSPFTIDVSATPVSNPAPPAVGLSATGGTITVLADSGTINAMSGITATALATGETGTNAGGAAQGGSATFTARNGGSLTGGSLSVDAGGQGGGGGNLGGAGRGGTIALDVNGADYSLSTTSLTATGNGGLASAGASGDGAGGSVTADFNNGTYTLSNLTINASAYSSEGGGTADSGSGRGGAAKLHVGNGANLTSGGPLSLSADGYAGLRGQATTVATGGNVDVLVDGGGVLSDVDSLTLSAEARLSGQTPASPNYAGATTGGATRVLADNGSITAANITARSDAHGSGALIAAGPATGGTATVGAINGGSVATSLGISAPTTVITVSAEGRGGYGDAPGNAQGGTALVYADGGTLTNTGNTNVSANALASAIGGLTPTNGFVATAGTASVELRQTGAGASNASLGSLVVQSDANADTGLGPIEPTGTGGLGQAGTARVVVSSGTLTTTDATVSANGTGGSSGSAPSGPRLVGGTGRGGTASFVTNGGAFSTGSLTVAATGTGGLGYGGNTTVVKARGGDAYGGTASLNLATGANTASAVLVDANAQGGAGGNDTDTLFGSIGGDGGNSTGGNASLLMPAASSANLTGPTTTVRANGTGGAGGSTLFGSRGHGGNGTGGTAGAQISDGQFTLSDTIIQAQGTGGTGAGATIGTGGLAQFNIADTLASPGLTRQVFQVTLDARGFEAPAVSAPFGPPSVRGNARMSLAVGAPTSGLSVTNNLLMTGRGAVTITPTDAIASLPGVETALTTSGAPLTVGGIVSLDASADTTIAAGAGADIRAATLSLSGNGSLTGTGQLTATGNSSAIYDKAIALTDINSGGSTVLQSRLGTVSVSHNLLSGGLVDVSGTGVNLVSLSALSFGTANATAGDFAVQTVGNLNTGAVNATGLVKLLSSSGSIAATGAIAGPGGIDLSAATGNVSVAGNLTTGGNLRVLTGGTFSGSPSVNAGGAVDLQAGAGLPLNAVTSGGTTRLVSTGGPVTVASLVSPGAVTVQGTSVNLTAPGGLTFADADATAGPLTVSAGGPLTFTTVDATGAISLTTSAGSLGVSGAMNGGGITLAAPGAITLGGPVASTAGFTTNGGATFAASAPISTTGAAAITAPGGIALAGLTSGSTLGLTTTGALSVTGAIVTGGTTTIATPSSINLTSLTSGGALNVTTTGGFTPSGAVSATGSTSITAPGGITAPSLTSGGSTQLSAANGSIVLANFNSVGPIIAQGQAVDLASGGALSFFLARATAGNLRIATIGNLAYDPTAAAVIPGGGFFSATGTVTLSSSNGNLSLPRVNGNGIALLAPNGLITASGPIVSTDYLTILTAGAYNGTLGTSAAGNLSIDAAQGINLATATSGGTTRLVSSGGPVAVTTNLASTGPVTASGTSVNLVSTGPLTFAAADATAGPLTVSAGGNLAFATVNATGPINLSTTTGSLSTSGGLSGGSVTMSAPTGIALGAPVNATGGFSATTGGSFAASGLLKATGPATITAPGGVTLAGLTSGGAFSASTTGTFSSSAAITAGGSITIGTPTSISLTSLNAAGFLQLVSSGALVATGPLGATGAVTINTSGGISALAVVSGSNTALIASNGAIALPSLTSTGPVTATARTIDIASPGALSFFTAQSTAGNLRIATTGNLAFIANPATGTLGSASATGTVLLSSSNGNLSLGPVSGNGISLLAPTGLISSGGSVASTDYLTILAAGTYSGAQGTTAATNLSIDAAQGINLATASAGGTARLFSSGGPVAVTTNLASSGPVTVTGTSVNLVSTGPLTFADADATAGPLSISTGSNLAVTTVDATGPITLTTSAGTLSASGAINGGGVALAAPGAISLAGPVNSTAGFSASTGGSFNATAPISANGNSSISAPGGLTLSTLTSGGTTTLSGGAISLGALASTGAVSASGNGVTIASPGALTFATLSGGTGAVTVSTVGDLSVSAVTGGTIQLTSNANLQTGGTVDGGTVTLSGNRSVTANGALVSRSGPLTLRSGGLVALNSTATAPDIIVTSADIALGNAARLGQRGTTQTITLNNVASSLMALGGADRPGSWSLSAAEALRLAADRLITFANPRNALGIAADVLIGDLAMTYGASGQIGAGGQIKILTPSKVTVSGKVDLTTISASDLFSIDPTRIEVLADTGSIAMHDSAGGLLGQLNLVADVISVATTSLQSGLIGSGAITPISQQLGTPSTVPSTPGYLSAGTIGFTVGSGLYIQNSGANMTFGARRGFTANSVTITTIRPTSQIVINGRSQPTGGGLPLTGASVMSSVSINGVPANGATGGTFDALSTINGCVIGRFCSDATGNTAPNKSDLTGKLSPGQPVALTLPVIEIAEIEGDPLLPLIEEPVTGVGNDDLWQPRCEESDAACAKGKDN